MGVCSISQAAPCHAALIRFRAAAGRAQHPRSSADVTPVRLRSETSCVHRSGQATQAGDTIWIYQDSLETRSSPSNEGGYTHVDASFQPAAWHIDTIYGCQGHSFWCGRVDSTWVQDVNRYGYDNG